MPPRIDLNPELPLEKTLNKFYNDFNFNERIKHDPIKYPRRYSHPEDIEVAGIIASCFAYGKVDLFMPVIDKILKPAGKHPAEFLKNFSLKRDKKYFKGIRFRFNKEVDILCLAFLLNKTLTEWGSLKNLFYSFYRPEHEDIGYALEKFTGYFLNVSTTPVYGRDIKPDGLKQFFPTPDRGSACKRMNLFLRWMVRTKDIDLGIWNSIPPSKLIIPLDVHIARIAYCLGLTKRTLSDWITAREITISLKAFDPEDPLKYDFALCHHGISRLCRGKRHKDICASCTLSF